MTLRDDAFASVTALADDWQARGDALDTAAARVTALEATLADVRALHEETRRLLAEAERRIADLQAELDRLTPKPAPLLGWYNGGPAADVEPLLGGTPEISSTYYQPDQTSHIVRKETERMQRGVVPLITITLKSGPVTLVDVANQTPAGEAFLNSYCEALHAVSQVEPSIPVYATLDHEFEVKRNQGVITGVTLNQYAKALARFSAVCRAAAPSVKVVYWCGGSDKASIGTVLRGLVSEAAVIDVIACDPYSTRSHPASETFLQSVGDEVAWLRGREEHALLGSPSLALGEFGIDTRHGDAACAVWLTDLRPKLAELDVVFALLFNRDSGAYSYKITNGPTPTAANAFAESFR